MKGKIINFKDRSSDYLRRESSFERTVSQLEAISFLLFFSGKKYPSDLQPYHPVKFEDMCESPTYTYRLYIFLDALL